MIKNNYDINNAASLLLIGSVLKTQGFEGEVLLRWEKEYEELISEKVSWLFLGISSNPVPFYVEKITILSQSARVKFEGVNCFEEAKKLTQVSVFLLPDSLPLSLQKRWKKKTDLLNNNIIGYSIFDRAGKETGKINDILLLPGQTIIQTIVNGKEVLIPANESTLLEISISQKSVKMDIPQGLTDLYLNKK